MKGAVYAVDGRKVDGFVVFVVVAVVVAIAAVAKMHSLTCEAG